MNPSREFLYNYFAFYCKPAEIVNCYLNWLEFCDQLKTKTRNNLIVEYDKNLKFYSRDEWEKMVAELYEL